MKPINPDDLGMPKNAKGEYEFHFTTVGTVGGNPAPVFSYSTLVTLDDGYQFVMTVTDSGFPVQPKLPIPKELQ